MSVTLRNKISGSGDFGHLREAGIRLFELLTGNIWTDYNTHDSGITILESCIYALTEFEHKAGLPVRSLLQDRGNTGSAFAPLSRSLYNKPVTLNDLRKILIDIYGISNSWFVEQDLPVPQLFADAAGVINMSTGDLLHVKGLLDVFIELSSSELKLIDPTLDFSDAELNGNILRSVTPASFPVAGGVENYFVELAFPYWESFPVDWQLPIVINSIVITGGSPAGIIYNSADDFFSASINVQYNTTQVFSPGVIIKMTPFYTKTIPLVMLQTYIGNLLSDITITGLIQRLNKKIITITKSIRGVHETLEENRGLGTVYSSVDAVRMQEIAIKADLRITESINPEQLITDFFLNLDKYLSPLPEAFSESELRSFNQTSEQIYNGPLLNNGFLLDNSLSEKRGNIVLYASDLINAMTGQGISNFPGTYKILSFSFSSYLNNNVIAGPSDNCLTLPNSEIYRPRLSVIKSHIRVFREGSLREVLYDKNKVLNDFMTQNVRRIKRIQLHHDETLLFNDPNAIPLDNGYHSIQNDFPQVYGIGTGTLSLSSTPDRVAKSRQLKAYLLFFEQILANHENQVNNLYRTLSLDPDLSSMMPSLPLYDVPDVAPLLLSFLSSGMSFEDFVNDPANNYVTALNNTLESPALFFQRRGRFLDHLNARFGEEMSSYTTFMLSKKYIDPAQVTLSKKTAEWKIIQDKLALLSEIATLEGDRHLGPDFTKFILLNEVNPAQWIWEIRDPATNTILLSASIATANALACFNDLFFSLNALLKPACYTISPVAPHQVSLVINPPAGAIKATAPLTFATLPEAKNHVDKITGLTSIIWNSTNVSGLEKKVARQTGFPGYRLRNLTNLNVDDYFVFGFDGALFNFSAEIEGFANPLRSAVGFPLLNTARATAIQTIQAGTNPANYTTVAAGALLNIQISDLSGLLAIIPVNITPGLQVNKLIEKLAVFFNRRFGSQEGFYLVEHITLLPVITTLTGVLDSTVFLSNPYLYQVSVIIPDGTDAGLLPAPAFQNRLKDPEFRTLLEKQFQKECPAHIFPFFIYPDAIGIAAFQGIYIRWRLWKHIINDNLPVLEVIQRNLVLWLNASTPIFPAYIN